MGASDGNVWRSSDDRMGRQFCVMWGLAGCVVFQFFMFCFVSYHAQRNLNSDLLMDLEERGGESALFADLSIFGWFAYSEDIPHLLMAAYGAGSLWLIWRILKLRRG